MDSSSIKGLLGILIILMAVVINNQYKMGDRIAELEKQLVEYKAVYKRDSRLQSYTTRQLRERLESLESRGTKPN